MMLESEPDPIVLGCAVLEAIHGRRCFTVAEIAAVSGLSECRISQIQATALKKLRRRLDKDLLDQLAQGRAERE